MSRKIILIKQELLLLVYELNRSGLLAENEKIRDRKSGSAGMPRPISYAVFCLKKKKKFAAVGTNVNKLVIIDAPPTLSRSLRSVRTCVDLRRAIGMPAVR